MLSVPSHFFSAFNGLSSRIDIGAVTVLGQDQLSLVELLKSSEPEDMMSHKNQNKLQIY